MPTVNRVLTLSGITAGLITITALGGLTSATAVERTPACRTHGLAASIHTRGGGTAGSLYVRLALRNVSGRVCHTGGFPGVSYVRDSGAIQIGAAATWIDPRQSRVLILQPGGRVISTLREVDAFDYPPSTCRPRQADGLRIYPPNQTISLFVPQPTTGCRNPAIHLLTVTPLRQAT